MYLCSRGGFRFSKITSIFLALVYLATPRFAAFLEAGHVGLINSIAWLPFILLATLKIAQKPNLKYTIILGLSLALLYYSHLPTFLVVTVFVTIFLLRKRTILSLCVAGIVTFGLTAISLLPQIEWQKYSTRYLLLKDQDVYPKWTSVLEPVKNALIPWSKGLSSLQQINTEKWLAIGLIPAFLAFWGFLKLKTRLKLYFAGAALVIFLIVLNNASPVYPILLKQNWYLLLRVSTRFWILIILAVLYLCGLAIEKTKLKFIYLLMALGILEAITLSWLYLNEPIGKDENLAPKSVYEFLSADLSRFRVFCLTRCLSQKEASIYRLELLDGYNTIQQKNFFQAAWQLTGAYWNYYTLSIPPLGALTEKLKPDAKALGKYNVKYLISPYPLADKNFALKTKVEKFFIYENKLLEPRANAPVTTYTPNFIQIDTRDFKGKQIILSEVYSPGWKAYLNGNKEITVQETPDGLRAVDIVEPDINFVDFKYEPKSYLPAKLITLTTILILISYGIYSKTKKQ